jgi:hypothetical protein
MLSVTHPEIRGKSLFPLASNFQSFRIQVWGFENPKSGFQGPGPEKSMMNNTASDTLLAAAADQINTELTIQLGVLDSLVGDSPSCNAGLAEAKASMQRLTFLASGMLNWAARRGVVRIHCTAERLITMDAGSPLAKAA